MTTDLGGKQSAAPAGRPVPVENDPAARTRPVRVAVVVCQPIQHFAPFYRAITEAGIDLRVLFASRDGLDPYFDRGFGAQVQWDASVAAGFEHEFISSAGGPVPLAMARGLTRLAPDCVLIHGYNHSYALAALAWARWRRVPALMFGDSEPLTPRPAAVRIVKRLTLPPTLAAVSGFLTIGDNNEDYLAAYGVPRSRMFRTPIPTDEAPLRAVLRDRASHRAAVRAEFGVPDGTLLALFAGKLVDRKRPRDIAAALRLLRDGSAASRLVGDASAAAGSPPITVVLAGDGELRGALEADAAGLGGALRLAGFVPPGRLVRLYAAADLYLHPAERDPHPLAIKEAVLAGLPVVTTDRVGSVGPTDDVRIGRNGRIHPVGDVAALAAILDDLSGDRDQLAAMARESSAVAGEIGLEAAVAAVTRALAAVGVSTGDRPTGI